MFSRSIFESLTDAQILPLGLICAKQMIWLVGWLVALMPCLKICFSFFEIEYEKVVKTANNCKYY